MSLPGSLFARGKITISQLSTTTNPYLRPQRELLTAFNGRLAELCDEKERRLRTHVAVLCSPSLAAHTQCLAGDDGRFVDQRLREHYLGGLRRAVQMVGPGGSCGRSVCLFLSVVLQWRSRVDLQWFLWHRPPSFYSGQWHSLAPVASYSWHAMEIRKRRSRCAENGLIDRPPTTLVCTVQTYSHRRGRRRFMGRGSGGCMGREGVREFGLVSYGRVSYGQKK